jgi:hypothetical protein
MKNWMMCAAAVATLLASSPALAQKVIVDSNPAATFASYRTYSWTVGTPAANPLAEQRIHALVDQKLAAKGFSNATADPDVVIATHVVTKEEKQLYVHDYGGFGWGYGYGFGGTRTATVDTYTVGTLVVDIYDAKTKTLVWRGTGTDTMSSKPEKNTGKANKALTKMFKQYPPTPGTK